MAQRIFVVDDEESIADLIKVFLENEGFEVLCFYDGASALAAFKEGVPDLAVLDVMLPDQSGFALCTQIRKRHLFPIIMLTAKVEDTDKISGLSLGADDYMTKPFSLLELVARVKTQLRRAGRYNAGAKPLEMTEEIDIRGLVINKLTHKVTLYDKILNLTPLEFSILWFLAQNKGRVVSSEELFEAVWEEKYFDSNNTVMAHIARLRDKMGEPAKKPKYIKTVWGVGYTIE